MTNKFIHLQLHTEYSLVDGTISLNPLFNKISDLKMPAVAITDIMNLYGLVKAYKKARSKGIKLIIGCELWIDTQNLISPQKSSLKLAKKPERVIVLCENKDGLKNLINLISDAYLSGPRFGAVPMIDINKLNEYMKWDSIYIEINLNLGSEKFQCYTCDFTNDYIDINADYKNST